MARLWNNPPPKKMQFCIILKILNGSRQRVPVSLQSNLPSNCPTPNVYICNWTPSW